MTQKKIMIDFAVDDDPGSIVELAKRLSAVREPDRTANVMLDATKSTYLGPFAAALLASFIDHVRSVGGACEIALPRLPSKLRAFCEYSGMTRDYAGGDEPDTNDEANETIRLHRFSAVTFQSADPVLALIRRHAELDAEAEDHLRISVNEVLQNCADHARSPVPATLCGRYISSKREVLIGVCDRGLGIRETLTKRFPEVRSDIDAIRKVIEGNYSAKSRKNNMGLGISNLARMVTEFGGRLTIITGEALVTVDSQSPTGRFESPERLSLRGTSVFWSLPLTQTA